MTIVKRLRLLTALLGTAAASAVIGTAVFGELGKSGVRTTGVRPAKPEGVSTDAFSGSKFANQPALTYKQRSGSTALVPSRPSREEVQRQPRREPSSGS